MSNLIRCPSGLSLIIRGMQGRELRFIQDKALIKSGAFLDKILEACAESVQDAGPYTLTDSGALDWDSVLPGDKFFALLRIRAETFGDEFTFDRKCGACKEPYQWRLNLSDLPIKELAPEDFLRLKNGEPMEIRVKSSGALVKYRLANAEDDRAAAKAKNETNALIAMFTRRVHSIEGVDTKTLRAHFESMSLGDLFGLAREMESHDCGVETTIEVYCPNCETVEKVGLPIGPGFWIPGRA